MTQAASPTGAVFAAPSPNTSSQLHWLRQPGLACVVLERPPIRELHLSLQAGRGDSVGELIKRVAIVLEENGASVVRQFVFGPVSAHAATVDAMRRSFGEVNWPVTWVEGDCCAGGPIAGIQIHAIGGAPIQTLTWNGRTIGRSFDDGEAKHCLLGDLGPFRTTATASDQAREAFDILEAALGLAGMTVKDVRRTWLFLDDIVSWYSSFNAARNTFFSRSGLQAGAFPASTGVGGRNPRGAALALSAWAINPYHPATRIQAVISPMQCPAIAYGSAFSRAVEIISSFHSRLLVSGTASITPDGRTAHVGDLPSQINLTMQVVEAILQSHGRNFADVTRATAYFKFASDFPLFAAWCNRHGLGQLPVLSACCDICRPEFLFEIEVDAIGSAAGGSL